MKILSKIVAVGSAVGVGAYTLIGEALAFTTWTGGFPVVEASDTSTMLEWVGSAGTGIMNFMISQWAVFVALAVAGAVVGLIYHFAGSVKRVVKGR